MARPGRNFGKWLVDFDADNHICFAPGLMNPDGSVQLPVWIIGIKGQTNWKQIRPSSLTLMNVEVRQNETHGDRPNIISWKRLAAANISNCDITKYPPGEVEYYKHRGKVQTQVLRNYSYEEKPVCLMVRLQAPGLQEEGWYAYLLSPQEQNQHNNWWKGRAELDREEEAKYTAKLAKNKERNKERRQVEAREQQERMRMSQRPTIDYDNEEDERRMFQEPTNDYDNEEDERRISQEPTNDYDNEEDERRMFQEPTNDYDNQKDERRMSQELTNVSDSGEDCEWEPDHGYYNVVYEYREGSR
ncbi:hypothetical protein H2200_012736 [Cladophialophora chaetospira]|uniref:Uncharacterized protein n=1 Tax=Cladophialophora chaetospira TaxID=386627 RepID=A0AA38WXI6_9EURO|nr:hypothetical protein H2200_012736 [Cladophialophora chaetospira]